MMYDTKSIYFVFKLFITVLIHTVAAATLYVCLNNVSIAFDNIPSDMHSLILLILDFDCDSLLLQVSRTYHCRNHILETCLH